MVVLRMGGVMLCGWLAVCSKASPAVHGMDEEENDVLITWEDLLVLKCLGPAESDWMGRLQEVGGRGGGGHGEERARR